MESLRATSHRAHLAKRGVTVIELLIVISIIGILTVVMVTSHTTFNKTILLSYTAYDVALTIRSAETYGLGTRVTGPGMPSNTGYGIHIEPNATSFTLFADKNDPRDSLCHELRTDDPEAWDAPDAIPGDCVYNEGEDVQEYSLGNGMKITMVYWYADADADATKVATSLDMVFSRPNPKAFMSYDGIFEPLIDACFEIASPQGGVSHVYIGSTGQVTVGSSVCPSAV